MNDRLPHWFLVSYSEKTNKLKLSRTQPNINLEIGVRTTCGELLGIVVGESSENGVYEAPSGINLHRHFTETSPELHTFIFEAIFELKIEIPFVWGLATIWRKSQLREVSTASKSIRNLFRNSR